MFRRCRPGLGSHDLGADETVTEFAIDLHAASSFASVYVVR